MTDTDFASIRDQVYASAGIVLGDHKREMVYSRLSRRLRLLKLDNFHAYLDYLEQNKTTEFSHFINAITTNLTSFFREKHHFEFLEQTVIPELLKKNSVDKRVRIWSAGCSTGEEPYSISMTITDKLVKPGWDVKVLATDLDSNVLAKASSGVYSDSNVGNLDLKIKSRCFVRNTKGDSYKIKPHFQSVIRFKRLNLLEKWPMKGQFDVIFCRNVVIYFDQETKEQLFNRYAQLLKPGGYLFLGHSESMNRGMSAFEPLGQTIYRRRG
ncbi:protein-glutamate O-methyltransferase CheR [Catenovulum sp. SM1970]|uniref:CheR family methyltransferase n=1 Tax=Marinifaba aquimaris TaxID=2741323 RepID=UPI0015740C5A|nr:protein-glutamate O-methyltransferase CheR [Marinifaba aquimaris]NTS76885.1 protein-glutamate O-methyltransferase CheR [Marinifaba aquimaris]